MALSDGFRPLFRRRDADRDVREEIECHLDLKARDLVESGMTPAAARAEAEQRFGDMERIRSQCLEVQAVIARRKVSRDVAEGLRRDLRIGLRSLRSRPAFTLVTLTTLAVGIGATAAIFSVVDAVILRPLTVPEAHRVVQVREEYPAGFRATSLPTYRDLAEESGVFEHATPLANWTFYAGDLGTWDMDAVALLEASADFLPLVGVQPMLGRGLLPDERFNHVAGPTSAVLTHGFWQRHFGGSEEALGSTFELTQVGWNDVLEFTVVGVLPPHFRMPPIETSRGSIQDYPERDVIIPPRMDENFVFGGEWSTSVLTHRSTAAYHVLGRLKPDVSIEQARARLDAVAARITETYPELAADLRLRVTPLPERVREHYGTTLYVLWAAASLLLLVACVNVASLLLARGVTRRAELALRAALGASRGRLFRQLFAESLLLGVLGGLAGLALGYLATGLLVAFVPAEVYRLEHAGVSRRVVAFVTLTSVGTAVLFGMLPAVRGMRPGGVQGLSGETRTSTTRLRVLDLLVVTEIAVALVLITGSGLLMRTYRNLTSVDLGFDRENLVTLTIASAPGADTGSRPEWAALYALVRDRFKELPGVVSVGGGYPPLNLATGSLRRATLADRPLPPAGERLEISWIGVGVGYLETLGARLVEGRTFTDVDDERRLAWTDPPGGCTSTWCDAEKLTLRFTSTLPVVINDVAARRFWPGESALGKVLFKGHFENPQGVMDRDYTWSQPAEVPVPYVVVGVVGEVKMQGLSSPPEPRVFDVWNSHWHAPFVVRTRTDPRRYLAEIESALTEMDLGLRVTDVDFMDERFARASANERFRTLLIGSFAAIAVLLATVGLFGVMAYTVRQRTREIGIRISFGATREDILRLTGRHGLGMLLAGSAIGLMGAWGVTRFMASLLYGVTPLDPLSFGGAALLLGVAGMLATYLPTRRAMRVDPQEVLRAE